MIEKVSQIALTYISPFLGIRERETEMSAREHARFIFERCSFQSISSHPGDSAPNREISQFRRNEIEREGGQSVGRYAEITDERRLQMSRLEKYIRFALAPLRSRFVTSQRRVASRRVEDV